MLASDPDRKITEAEWLNKAKQFGGTFLELYEPEEITPYIHVLIYHVGFYLEHYGNLEVFANMAIEGRVKYTKQLIATATNGFSRMESASNLPVQILQTSTREMMANLKGVNRKRKRSKGWLVIIIYLTLC